MLRCLICSRCAILLKTVLEFHLAFALTMAKLFESNVLTSNASTMGRRWIWGTKQDLPFPQMAKASYMSCFV